jgi:hypothetical protein
MGVHDRDWYQEHYKEKVLGIRKRFRWLKPLPSSPAQLPVTSEPPFVDNLKRLPPRREFHRRHGWWERNWWRLLVILVGLGLVLAALKGLLLSVA